MYFLGIDPGKSGGSVLLNNEAVLILAHHNPIPTVENNLKIISFLEKVHAFPGQGLSSTFTFGVEFGRVQGWLAGQGLEFELVTPQTWQKILPGGVDPKERVRQFCEVQWGLDVFIPSRCRVPHQGMMDAACIAEYGRRLSLGLIEPVKTKTKPKRRAALKL